MPALQPKPGFDWPRVTWGAPDDRPSDICSYCVTTIPDHVVPLMMWKDDGACARFCDACAAEHWGIKTFPEQPE